MRDKELFITCPENFEPLLMEELRSLGISKVRPGFRGVFTPASMQTVYTINYNSRIATRVLYPLRAFSCRHREDLYRAIREMSWDAFLNADTTFAIDANVSHPRLTHSLFTAQVMKDAICDQIREKTGFRPSIDVKNPNVQLHLFIQSQKAIVSFDTSGAPLFKRGWRSASTSTSIQENLAAGLLLQAGYNANTILCDPFCGSGTFLIEAALIATRTPPGFFRRHWGFFHLPQFNAETWESFKKTRDEQRIALEPNHLFGADKDFTTLQACKDHVRKIGASEQIQLQQADIIKYKPPISPTLILTDPPFGKRLETSQRLYQELGAFIQKTLTPHGKAFVLAPDARYLSSAGLSIEGAFAFHHGGLNISAFRVNNSPYAKNSHFGLHRSPGV